jgi:hypothetical protein
MKAVNRFRFWDIDSRFRPKIEELARCPGARPEICALNPFLVAFKVEDLAVVHAAEKRVEIVSYTRQPAFRFNRKTRETERVGSPLSVQLELKY